MSLEYIERIKAPFYEMSRTLTFLGAGRRFESLVAAGMTIGYFVLITYFLQITTKAWEVSKTMKPGVWISTAFAGLVFLSGMRMNSRLLAVGTLGIWVLLPTFEKITKNIKKPIDK